ncbi:MAG TPA: vanadium-dependent haloperoxidase [Candidatus Angelobacter sp.]|nr:vanadium-dependent haloperoxidase [Candidatus Angelobacter sp.]
MKILLMLLLCASLLPQATWANSFVNDDNQGTAAAPQQALNPVVQWNKVLLTILRTPGAQPSTIHPTRSFAIMHAAIYDAVNAIDKTHAPYAVRLNDASRNASQDAAAATAAHDVLTALYPKFQATLDAQLQQSLAAIQDGTHQQEGIAIGTEVARRILAIRSTDGSDAALIPFVPIDAPGQYQLTPPNFPKPAFTHWSHVTPFTLRRADQFRPGLPPSLASDTYSDAFNEVKSLGIGNSTTRTADQTVIGRFWGGAIQNYWNEIAQTASEAHHLTTAQNARLFALLNLTAADSVIAFYDAKYTFRFWRPVTAIRAADTDGNPETAADPNWLPLPVNTAGDPSYPGAHSAISFASAFVLRSFFKSDHFTFNVTSEVLPGVERSFTRFSAAATEAGLSRIFAGQHFRFDHVAGLHLGESVADFVTDHFLGRRESDDERGDR